MRPGARNTGARRIRTERGPCRRDPHGAPGVPPDPDGAPGVPPDPGLTQMPRAARIVSFSEPIVASTADGS